MGLRLYNTLSRSVEEFSPLSPPRVTMYNCGPTVYNWVHIGNLRAYVFADVLRRALVREGYEVRQIVNITDVGHLVSDSDEGDDKIEIGARREGKSAEEIIAMYSDAFFADLAKLDVLPAEAYPRATNYIVEQKAMIETLASRGYAYITSDGIYFDTSRFDRYADLARLDVAGLKSGLRVDMGEKLHPTDFALWKFSPKDGKRREQEWDSPLGIAKKGFPGWHIECSAIVKATLGETIDIHTGGIDHIPIHHTNEIAQSECANGAPLARFWMHSAFMTVEGEKMSKSLGNTYRLTDLHERGIPPLAFRYWLLQAHYRTQLNFTWDALAGAQSAYNRLTNFMHETTEERGAANEDYIEKLDAALADDLNTASAIALVFGVAKDAALSLGDRRATLMEFDRALGLGLGRIERSAPAPLSPLVERILEMRKAARERKDWAEADRLRDELLTHRIEVKDTPEGQIARPLPAL